MMAIGFKLVAGTFFCLGLFVVILAVLGIKEARRSGQKMTRAILIELAVSIPFFLMAFYAQRVAASL